MLTRSDAGNLQKDETIHLPRNVVKTKHIGDSIV